MLLKNELERIGCKRVKIHEHTLSYAAGDFIRITAEMQHKDYEVNIPDHIITFTRLQDIKKWSDATLDEAHIIRKIIRAWEEDIK